MKYTPEKIFDLYNTWHDYYNNNNVKAFRSLRFTSGDQWNKNIKNSRTLNNKACLVFNNVQRLAKMVESEISSFNYGIKIIERSVQDPQKIKLAQKIFEHILLSDQYKDTFCKGIVKSLMFGYSVARITLDYENSVSLQQIPKVHFLDNPEFAFFDKMAEQPYKEDSRFCGIKKRFKASKVRSLYGNKAADEDDSDIIHIIYFWYKDSKEIEFFELRNGEYKRQDKITSRDDITGRTKTRNIDVVYSMIVREDKVIRKPEMHLGGNEKTYITDNLPLIFFGQTQKYNDVVKNENTMKESTTPFAYNLIGSQKLLNLAGSNVFDMVNKQTKRKFFALPYQVKNNEEDFRNINDREGTILVGDQRADEVNLVNQNINPQTVFPQLVEPEKFNTDLLNVMAIARQTMNDLAGVNVSQQGAAEDKSVSGSAVNARIAQGSMIHQSLIKYFNGGINLIGKIMKDIFPYVIKNEYKILDKGEEIAVLNKKETGENNLIKSIKKLNEDYDIKIEILTKSRIKKI